MKIKERKGGGWEFDSGEIRGTRTRLRFDTRADAEAWLRKAEAFRKDDGEKLLVEWLSISANEIAQIVRYRREMQKLNEEPDWDKGRKLHIAWELTPYISFNA